MSEFALHRTLFNEADQKSRPSSERINQRVADFLDKMGTKIILVTRKLFSKQIKNNFENCARDQWRQMNLE